jgi:hypothetical protein
MLGHNHLLDDVDGNKKVIGIRSQVAKEFFHQVGGKLYYQFIE